MHPCIAISVQYNQLITVCPFKETQKKKKHKKFLWKEQFNLWAIFPSNVPCDTLNDLQSQRWGHLINWLIQKVLSQLVYPLSSYFLPLIYCPEFTSRSLSPFLSSFRSAACSKESCASWRNTINISVFFPSQITSQNIWTSCLLPKVRLVRAPLAFVLRKM